jgi:SHS2 domain-containing protein
VRPELRYGSFPTTADVGLWARGHSASDLFSALGVGLFALTTDLRRVRLRDQRTVRASADDPAALVVAFLNELIGLSQSEGFLGRRVRAHTVGTPPTAVLATVEGESFDPARHSSRMEVKAATFHHLELDLTRYRARVIVDI